MAETNRGTTWEDKEVKALLTIWGDTKIQEELDGAVCNKVVYERIAKRLQELGGRKSCKFFNELEILGHGQVQCLQLFWIQAGDSELEAESEEEVDGN